MRTVFVTGKDGLTPREAAIMLVHEARTLVQVINTNEIERFRIILKSNNFIFEL